MPMECDASKRIEDGADDAQTDSRQSDGDDDRSRWPWLVAITSIVLAWLRLALAAERPLQRERAGQEVDDPAGDEPRRESGSITSWTPSCGRIGPRQAAVRQEGGGTASERVMRASRPCPLRTSRGGRRTAVDEVARLAQR